MLRSPHLYVLFFNFLVTCSGYSHSCSYAGSCPANLQCGDNEKVNYCPNGCDNDACPDPNQNNGVCVASAVCGPPACQCIEGYKRDYRGICIPIEQCPNLQCGDNEKVNYCTNGCDNDACPDPNNQSKEPCIAPAVCGPPACQCIEGYKRDYRGICIPIEQCQPTKCNGQHEVLSCVQDCPPERTCRNRGIQFFCTLIYKPCQYKCVCEKGYFRNAIGECITGKECDQCLGDNEFFSCGSACDNECATLNTQNRTNCPIKNIVCNRKCYCEDGYARDCQGKCVPVDQCPPGLQCGPNEKVNYCTSRCDNDACPDPNNQSKEPCIAPAVCGPPACQCIEGYKRDYRGICIPIEQCPNLQCGPNEKVNYCTNGCDNDACPDPNQNNGTCVAPAVCGPPACQCMKGFKRDYRGICIPIEQCPNLQCGPNEKVNYCTNGCDNDACPDPNQNTGACVAPAVCGPPACQCIKGFKRDYRGICIPIEQCPDLQCGDNEKVNYCTSRCDNDACPDPNNQSKEPCIAPAVCGPPACQCIEGYKRDYRGICIPIEQCPPPQCNGQHEVLRCVQDCPPERTCRNRFIQFSCILSIQPCKYKCVCKKGYFRNAIGECITGKECDQCSGDNEFFSCGSACDNECATINTQNRTTCPIINIVCNRKCYCEDGYARDSQRKCVPVDQCPPICGDNEKVNYCTSRCDNDACPDPNNQSKEPCIAPAVCGPPACQCIEGYKRDYRGICIPIEQCPNLQCGVNEKVNYCTNGCDNDACPDPNQNTGACVAPAVCGPPACQCIEGYKRDYRGICIPIEQCPPLQCNRQHEVLRCVQDCPPQKTCRNRFIQFSCILSIQPCKYKCVCKKGYFRNAIGECITGKECDQCSGDNEFFSCGSACDNECATINTQNRTTCPIINIVCNRKCYCEDGYARDSQRKCVPVDQCPPICGDNEKVNYCTSRCDNDACPDPNNQSKEPCIAPDVCGPPACQCIEGYKRDYRGICIPIEQCPNLQCGINERVNYCTNGCDNDACPDLNQNKGTCVAPAVCGPPACQCIEGYKRDYRGICIPIEQCPPPQCNGQHEVLRCVQDCPPQKTCRNRFIQFSCILSIQPCIYKCVCKKGYFRNAIGECITGKECDQCSGDNEFFSCGSACDNECATLNTQNRTTCPIINIVCNRKCYCEDGYARDSQRKCVPVDQCPPICGDNEKVNYCTNGCDNDACPDPNQNTGACVAPAVCGPPACQCIEGYKRDYRGICIPIEQCPSLQCGPNEKVNYCTNGCDNDACPDPNQNNGACVAPAVCGPPACQCIEGYKRDYRGICIPIEQCPNLQCGDNEKVNYCTSRCDNDACPDPNNQSKEPCIAPAVCGPPACQCIEGYKRDYRGICIPIEQCQPLKCNGQNEVLSCVQDCPPEKTCRNRDIQFYCLLIYKPCQLKCVCKEGYFRNAIGECITGEQCDQCSAENEFFSCGSACDNECSKLDTQNRTNCPIKNVVCNPKCYCEDGYARDCQGKCVPIDKCPPRKKCADPNEVYSHCKKTCPPDQCFSLVAKFKCPENPKCEPGCSCKPGYLREKDGSPCIPICECPQMKNSPDCNKTISW